MASFSSTFSWFMFQCLSNFLYNPIQSTNIRYLLFNLYDTFRNWQNTLDSYSVVALDDNLAKLKNCSIKFIYYCHHKIRELLVHFLALEEIRFFLLTSKVEWKRPSPFPSRINRNFDTEIQSEEHLFLIICEFPGIRQSCTRNCRQM